MLAYSVVAVALASFAAAQNTTVNIGALSATLKAQWCTAQQVACPELCGGASDLANNDCDPTTLVINCQCTNGSAPGLAYYINTVPTFLCEQTYSDCKAANAGNANAQKQCDAAESLCGKQDPSKYSPPSASSSTSASESATSTSASGTAAPAATSTSSKGAAPTMAMARELGTGAFVLGAAALGLVI